MRATLDLITADCGTHRVQVECDFERSEAVFAEYEWGIAELALALLAAQLKEFGHDLLLWKANGWIT
jgi:hypothetical protein